MSDPVTRLNAALEGRYRIERELGEGGMATVYLADDLRHERKVALKVLRPELAAAVGAERFLAEIKTTANLQHPHILPLYDSGEADGLLFYVMPYVEGESLEDRLDRVRQLPVDDAVRITTNMAEALDYAHRQGVIHRDIKPANLLLQDGKPLISDFGIALAVGAAGAGRLTHSGQLLGTPLYMSPEQATGDAGAGPATDIWALACVLYEMLVGEPPFTGRTRQAVLGRVISHEPHPVRSRRKSVPPHVDAAVRKAMEKLPGDRFSDAHGFASALGDSRFRYGEDGAVGAAGFWKGLAAVLAVGLAIAVGWPLMRSGQVEPPGRYSSPFETGQFPAETGQMSFIGDGSALVYAGPSTSGTQLWLRRWSDLSATPIRGTEGAITAAVSPDGQEVAFTPAAGPLRVVPLDGGPVRTLVSSSAGVSDWASDGTVYFTVGTHPWVLARVPGRASDEPAVTHLTELLPGEASHGFLTLLPGGRMAVFQVRRSLAPDAQEVWALDLETLERTLLTPGTSPHYASSGHLLFVTPEGVLMAAPIDPETAVLTGPPVAVADGLAVALGLAFYAVSERGTLLYAAGERAQGLWEPVWVDRSGAAVPVDPQWRFDVIQSTGLAISPDGTRAAVTRSAGGNEDVWVKDLPDGPFERLTFDDLGEVSPFWHPDGESLAYSRGDSASGMGLWRRAADGSGSPEPLVEREGSYLLQGRWSPNGEWLVYSRITPPSPGEVDIVGFRPGRDGDPRPLVAAAGVREQAPSISPNGRWLAYASNESGRNEVYVTSFPDADVEPVPVSRNGGQAPLWAHSGRELFFVNPAEPTLVAAEVQADSAFRVLGTETLFTLGPNYAVLEVSDFYAVRPGDDRFLMLRVPIAAGEATGSSRFVLVTNWFTELCERIGEC